MCCYVARSEAIYLLINQGTRASELGPSWDGVTIRMKFQEFLNHPAGPRTIHFWAPAMKWALVVAGLADVTRPPERISPLQTSGTPKGGRVHHEHW